MIKGLKEFVSCNTCWILWYAKFSKSVFECADERKIRPEIEVVWHNMPP
jgi:hypothetical protein